MSSQKKPHSPHNSQNRSRGQVQSPQNGNVYTDIPLTQRRVAQRTSMIEPLDLSEVPHALTTYNGYEYQLIPVEIEKEAELGMVLGQIEGEQWIFVDEILPNGMIEMHGILKEADYLIQAGIYSLVGVDVRTALVLVERAYEEGRKTITFVAARQQKPDLKSKSLNKHKLTDDIDRKASRARSFVDYENEEEEAYVDDRKMQKKPISPTRRSKKNDTQF